MRGQACSVPDSRHRDTLLINVLHGENIRGQSMSTRTRTTELSVEESEQRCGPGRRRIPTGSGAIKCVETSVPIRLIIYM